MIGGTGLRRLTTVLIGVAVLLVAGPAVGPASAHSRLLRTDPAGGTTVTRPISELTLTFNEVVRGDFTTVVVTGPDDLGYGDGKVEVIDTVVHQKTQPLRSGSYRVAWRAISIDGHPVEGQFQFTVALPAGQEPTNSPSRRPAAPVANAATDSGPGDGWWWAVGTLAAVAVVTLGVLLVRRRRGAEQS